MSRSAFIPRVAPTMTMAAVCVGLCAGSAAAPAETAVLATWRAVWSPYRLVDDRGTERRLAKATLDAPPPPVPLSGPAASGQTLVLRTSGGEVIGSEPLTATKKGPWAHGFWVPEAAARGQFILELRTGEKVLESRPVAIANGGEAPAPPLRLDSLNRSLLARLESREVDAVPDHRADVVSYLRQHDLVYLDPAPTWGEGLPLGNGDMGGLVGGKRGAQQTFYLDKTDIWLATPDGKAAGRSYAGTLRLRYGGGAKSGAFRQRLSLGRAELTTQDGDFRSTARVHALRNSLDVTVEGADFEIVLERDTIPLDPKGAYLYGYFNLSETWLAPKRARAEAGPHTQVEWGAGGKQCWFVHTAPNLRCALLVSVSGADVEWHPAAGSYVGRVRTAGHPVEIHTTIATSRESADPLARARQLVGNTDRDSHLRWWRDYWSRSWVELPDKLEENLWYIGLYQQACVSRSDQAVSFFGLFHPLNLKGWWDGYVTDAQVQMMWWETFAANHLEMLYPSHRTFGRIAAEFAAHTPGPGMVAAHLFTPEWAGGGQFINGDNPYKGSTAWYTMNFWWDYLYSGDRKLLREVTYPLLRMTADDMAGRLVRESDGHYHCVHSGSPEQSNTARDNVYDWGLITYLFRTTIRASEILNVDSELRPKWQEILDHLFPAPGDGKTLWETPASPHPYRCHPVVFFGLYPTRAIAYGSPEFEAARRTMPVVTKLLAFHYDDRHETIPGFEGGVEVMGFSSGILTIAAVRLQDRAEYERFLYQLIVRFHMKQNGLRALLDTRQADEIVRASLVEAANSQTVATTETLLQSWDDHVRLFPCIGSTGRYRFSGLRAEGGFVISGEARDGELRWAQVKSLEGGTLRLALPKHGQLKLQVTTPDGGLNVGLPEHGKAELRAGRGAPATFGWITAGGEQRLELQCRAGATYDILAAGPVDWKLPSTEPRSEARVVAIAAVESRGARLLHYPEDLPFGQVVQDGSLYLGRPDRFGSPLPAPDVRKVLAEAASTDWQDRQEAARLLGRVTPSAEVLAALDRLCSDQVTVVAHTAAVTLVRLGTPESLKLADEHARRDAVLGLRREVEKARRRYNVPSG